MGRTSRTFQIDISPKFLSFRVARREPSGLNFIEKPPTGIRRESIFSVLRFNNLISFSPPMLNLFRPD